MQEPVPVQLFYEIRRCTGISKPKVQSLNGKEAFLALVRNLYNIALLTPDSLVRQFHQIGELAKRIPVRQLLLPRSTPDLLCLPNLVLKDLQKLPRG